MSLFTPKKVSNRENEEDAWSVETGVEGGVDRGVSSFWCRGARVGAEELSRLDETTLAPGDGRHSERTSRSV